MQQGLRFGDRMGRRKLPQIHPWICGFAYCPPLPHISSSAQRMGAAEAGTTRYGGVVSDTVPQDLRGHGLALLPLIGTKIITMELSPMVVGFSQIKGVLCLWYEPFVHRPTHSLKAAVGGSGGLARNAVAENAVTGPEGWPQLLLT